LKQEKKEIKTKLSGKVYFVPGLAFLNSPLASFYYFPLLIDLDANLFRTRIKYPKANSNN